LIDVNGEGPGDVLKGLIAALTDYTTFGLTDFRNWTEVAPEDAADYNKGLQIADAFVIAVAVAEIGGGTGLTGSGILTIEAGVATLIVPGVGEVTFVIAEVAGAAEILAGIGLVAHGNYVLKMAKTNQSEQNGYRKGGGKNAKHKNTQQKESAKEKYEQSKQQFEELKSKRNKTPEEKKQLDKLKKQVEHNKRKMDDNGENHSQKAKGS